MRKDELRILEYRNSFVVVNKNGAYCNHTHLRRRDTCQLLIRLVKAKRVPRSPYRRTSAKRVTLDDKYIKAIDHKIAKDRNKQAYYNKGVR